MLDGTVKNRSPTLHRTGNALRWGLHELAVVGFVVCLLTLYDAASHAQLAVPGPSGVVMGHLHLATTDVEASRRFWAALAARGETSSGGLSERYQELSVQTPDRPVR